jgi:hypothetical protein
VPNLENNKSLHESTTDEITIPVKSDFQPRATIKLGHIMKKEGCPMNISGITILDQDAQEAEL